MGKRKSQRKQMDVLGRLTGQEIRAGKKVKLGDGWYRVRRGKLVRIPDEWMNRPVEMCGDSRLWREYKLAQRRGHSRKYRRRKGSWDGRVERSRREGKGYRPDGKMRHPRNRSPRHLARGGRRDQYDGLR